MIRQQPYARLIEEIRLLDFGDEFQGELKTDMTIGLMTWLKTKPIANNRPSKQIVALVMSVFGGWIFSLSKANKDSPADSLREIMLNDWATLWAAVLYKSSRVRDLPQEGRRKAGSLDAYKFRSSKLA